MEAMFVNADENGDGQIDIMEFLQARDRSRVICSFAEVEYHDYKRLFDDCDVKRRVARFLFFCFLFFLIGE